MYEPVVPTAGAGSAGRVWDGHAVAAVRSDEVSRE